MEILATEEIIEQRLKEYKLTLMVCERSKQGGEADYYTDQVSQLEAHLDKLYFDGYPSEKESELPPAHPLAGVITGLSPEQIEFIQDSEDDEIKTAILEMLEMQLDFEIIHRRSTIQRKQPSHNRHDFVPKRTESSHSLQSNQSSESWSASTTGSGTKSRKNKSKHRHKSKMSLNNNIKSERSHVKVWSSKKNRSSRTKSASHQSQPSHSDNTVKDMSIDTQRFSFSTSDLKDSKSAPSHDSQQYGGHVKLGPKMFDPPSRHSSTNSLFNKPTIPEIEHVYTPVEKLSKTHRKSEVVQPPKPVPHKTHKHKRSLSRSLSKSLSKLDFWQMLSAKNNSSDTEDTVSSQGTVV